MNENEFSNQILETLKVVSVLRCFGFSKVFKSLAVLGGRKLILWYLRVDISTPYQ